MYNELDFKLFDALRHAERSLRAHRPGSADCKGGPAAKREIILAILADNQGDMRQNQLASAFRVSPSTLSQMLDRLEEDRMITRGSDPADRRATLLSLTDKGRERADWIKEETGKAFAETFEGLNEDEKRQLIVLLRKISEPQKAGNNPA